MNTRSILILSDTHFPYQIPGYFEWIKKIKDKINPSMVLHIGDLVDFHSVSQHLHSAELPNIKYEIKDAIKCIKKLRKIFLDILVINNLLFFLFFLYILYLLQKYAKY